MTLLTLDVPWWGTLPFAALLACIAVLPLLPATAHRWERNRVKLALGLALGLPVAIWVWTMGHEGQEAVLHAIVEYGQFVALLLALFVIAGGIHLAGDLEASPRTNTLLLAVGGVLASFIGTTGAAMLMIRPVLRTNGQRASRVHTVVFFVFVVANCGGLLTPLGDPPLFLGMLRGVPFTWTFTLIGPWLFVNGLLLLLYYALDAAMHAREAPEALRRDATDVQPLRLHGGLNLVFLAAVIAAVAFVPSIDVHELATGHAGWTGWVPWRELVFVTATVASLRFGDRWAREHGNRFAWPPILEVAALFAGVFLTMVPALQYLTTIAPRLPLNDVTFFVFTGGLSALLDNAPTYATFFELARALAEGQPSGALVAGVIESHLVAISLGAVFCGALTYIGNGPNFLVKAVAETDGVAMPSFGGYAGWALRHLGPVLVAMVCVFLSGQPVVIAAGWLLALGLAGRAALSLKSAARYRGETNRQYPDARE